ncbi:MAG: hypothetical protein H8D28_07625 [Candidatus Thioglobus sp.]|nr:hypothetical protein [Candidatus Pseudothioglobus aerophilus]
MHPSPSLLDNIFWGTRRTGQPHGKHKGNGRRSGDKYGLYKDIKDQGYCLSTNTHNKTLFALAVPVISSSDKFVGSIVVSGPKDNFDEGQKKSLIDLLKNQLKGVVNKNGRLIS